MNMLKRRALVLVSLLLLPLSILSPASAADPTQPVAIETALEASAVKPEAVLKAQLEAAYQSKDKKGFRQAFEEAALAVARKEIGDGNIVFVDFAGPKELGFRQSIPAGAETTGKVRTQDNEFCSASIVYAQTPDQRGKVTASFIVSCGWPTDINFTLTAAGKWLESTTTQQLDLQELKTQYTRWMWPQNVGKIEYSSVSSYAYETANIVKVWGANWSFFAERQQWWGNKKGDLYPRVSAVGRRGIVPFPVGETFHPDRSSRRDGDLFAANCQKYYKKKGWRYYTGDGWENHHIQPLRWGGDNDGANCFRLSASDHVKLSTWWHTRNFETPASH